MASTPASLPSILCKSFAEQGLCTLRLRHESYPHMLHTPGSTCQNNIIRNCACRDGAKGCLTQWFQNAALTLACVASGGDCAKEHPHDWTHRVRQDRNCKAVGQTSRRSLCQGAPCQFEQNTAQKTTPLLKVIVPGSILDHWNTTLLLMCNSYTSCFVHKNNIFVV